MGRLAEQTRTRSAVAPFAYLFFIGIAEVVSVFVSPAAGLLLYSLVLLSLFLTVAVAKQEALRRFALGLVLVPLARLIAFLLPLHLFEPLWQTVAVGVLLLIAVALVARRLPVGREELGLRITSGRGFWPYLGASVLGVVLGSVAYLIIESPLQLSPMSSPSRIIAVAVMVVGLAGLDELVFRGVLLHVSGGTASEDSGSMLEKWPALFYVAFLYGLMQAIYASWVFVILAVLGGLAFGWLVSDTRTLMPAILGHAWFNLAFFLIVPLFV